MHEYDDAVLKCFLENQGQLFPEDVASTMEEAEAFLEDCMAVVVDSPEEVEDYLDEKVWIPARVTFWMLLKYLMSAMADI